MKGQQTASLRSQENHASPVAPLQRESGRLTTRELVLRGCCLLSPTTVHLGNMDPSAMPPGSAIGSGFSARPMGGGGCCDDCMVAFPCDVVRASLACS